MDNEISTLIVCLYSNEIMFSLTLYNIIFLQNETFYFVKYKKNKNIYNLHTNKMSFVSTLTFTCIEMEFPTQFRMFGFSEIMRVSAQRRAEETGW